MTMLQNLSGWLITPTLYSNYYWFLHSDNKTDEDFLKVLRREPVDQTDAMKAGVAFENKIRAVCEGKDTVEEGTELEEFVNILRGGFWQEKMSKLFDGNLLYGIADVIKYDTIYDVKFTTETFDKNRYTIGKYDWSIQHLVYMYCSGMKRMKYLICDGAEFAVEEHVWTAESLVTLQSRIWEMLQFILGNQKFKEAFEANWRYKNVAE